MIRSMPSPPQNGCRAAAQLAERQGKAGDIPGHAVQIPVAVPHRKAIARRRRQGGEAAPQPQGQSRRQHQQHRKSRQIAAPGRAHGGVLTGVHGPQAQHRQPGAGPRCRRDQQQRLPDNALRRQEQAPLAQGQQHQAGGDDLIKLLEKQGITCERKSIYSDIKALNSINIPVVSASVPKKGFYLAARKFEPAEIRLLIDAVNSAGFITPKKTADLTEKLNNLLSVYQSEELASQVYCEQANKCNNEEIYHTINVLDSAIKNCEKVKFQHRTRKIDKEKRKSYTTKTFIVSPYGLVWKNDNYYLICNKESHNNLISMRLDRIRNIIVLKTPARPVWECCDYKDGFDVADYTSKMFNMFGGEIMPVTFVCDLDLREQILDRFGEKVT